MGRARSSSGALAILSALSLAACGGSSSPKANDAALRHGALTAGQLGGMAPETTAPDNNITDWVAGESMSGAQAQAESARLRKIGFVAGISEQLASPTNRDRYGLTIAEQFKDAQGAKAELTHTVATVGTPTSFPVPGVPGARGFEQDGATGGRNIAFTHGDYYYLIGSGWQVKAADGVPRAAMIVAAQKLYHRVAG